MRTLCLTSSYEPLAAISWERAMTLVFAGKAQIVSNYDKFVRSASQAWPVPAVIRLVKYFKRRRYVARLSKTTLMARDHYTCQYCGKKLSPKEVTFDHVQPRSKGGATDWCNLVVACGPDNLRKGCRTPAEAGMVLKKSPTVPSWLVGIRHDLEAGETPAEWNMFLENQ